MKFLKLFADCSIVDGFLNSVIVDMQRGVYLVIPKTLSVILKKCETQSIDNIRKEIDEDSLVHYDSYIDFVLSNEFGFITKNPENYIYPTTRKVDLLEHNMVCENYNFILDYPNLFLDIVVSAIYIRIDYKFEIETLTDLLKILKANDNIKFVHLCADYNENISEEALREIAFKYPIFGQLNLYSSPQTETKVYDEISIEYSHKKYHGFKSCGLISSKYFSCRSKLFSESLYHNTCLNRKISLSVNGDIKNCPSMSESFGNIKDTTLAEALEKPGFKKFWNINKDKIHVCKDCEFRYICTDCRAYVEDPEDILSKPLKCGYNPYSGEWSEWSSNPLKQKAIDFYGIGEAAGETI